MGKVSYLGLFGACIDSMSFVTKDASALKSILSGYGLGTHKKDKKVASILRGSATTGSKYRFSGRDKFSTCESTFNSLGATNGARVCKVLAGRKAFSSTAKFASDYCGFVKGLCDSGESVKIASIAAELRYGNPCVKFSALGDGEKVVTDAPLSTSPPEAPTADSIKERAGDFSSMEAEAKELITSVYTVDAGGANVVLDAKAFLTYVLDQHGVAVFVETATMLMKGMDRLKEVETSWMGGVENIIISPVYDTSFAIQISADYGRTILGTTATTVVVGEGEEASSKPSKIKVSDWYFLFEDILG